MITSLLELDKAATMLALQVAPDTRIGFPCLVTKIRWRVESVAFESSYVSLFSNISIYLEFYKFWHVLLFLIDDN